MKKKDFINLKELAPAELHKKMKTIFLDLKRIHLDSNLGKMKNTNLLGQKKRDIARIKTILKAKEILQK